MLSFRGLTFNETCDTVNSVSPIDELLALPVRDLSLRFVSPV